MMCREISLHCLFSAHFIFLSPFAGRHFVLLQMKFLLFLRFIFSLLFSSRAPRQSVAVRCTKIPYFMHYDAMQKSTFNSALYQLSVNVPVCLSGGAPLHTKTLCKLNSAA